MLFGRFHWLSAISQLRWRKVEDAATPAKQATKLIQNALALQKITHSLLKTNEYTK